MRVAWWLCCSIWSVYVSAVWGREAEWSVVSSLSVSSVEAPHNSSEFRLVTTLRVTPEWSAPDAPDDDRLLRFQLSEVSLQTLRGAKWSRRDSVWTQYAARPVYARLQRGRVAAVWLHHDQPHYYTNYERALLSLFQFQVSVDAEFWNETDIAGECSGFYEQMAPHIYRKIKRRCVWEGAVTSAAEEEEAAVTSRRLTRVELAPATSDILAANLIVSEEETRVGGVAGVRVRVWSRLQRTSPSPTHSHERSLSHEPPAPPLPLSSLLPHYDAHDQLDDDKVELVRLVSSALSRVSEGEPFAEAALEVLPALERADLANLTALIEHPWEDEQLAGVWRLTALSGTLSAWRVAARALALGAADSHTLAHDYLHTLGHARPQDEVVHALVSLCGSARSQEVRAACVVSAGGAARHAGGTARQQALNYLLTALADCKDDASCSAAVSGAAAAQCGACVDALRHILTHTRHTHARILACGALSSMSTRTLGVATLRALQRVTLSLDRAEPIEVRGAALCAWLRVCACAAVSVHAAAQEHGITMQHDVTLGDDVTHMFQELAHRGPAELLRLAWQQLLALAEEEPGARAHVRLLRTLPRLHHYYQPGMSFAVSVEAWRAAGRFVRVRGAAAARRGVLRDARVALTLHGGDGDTDSVPLAALQLRTTGMHHVATEMPTKEERQESDSLSSSMEQEEPGAWLGVEAWGHAHALPLFTSQGSLAAAVWSGAGAEWSRVRRDVTRPACLYSARVSAALGVLLHVREHTVADLSVHAHAQVSLWSRSAVLGAGAALRGGREAEAALHTAWGAARVRRVTRAAAALRVPAEADFYNDVAVCARPSLEPLIIRSETVVEGAWGGHKVRRSHSSVVRHAARCVSLGADNDAQCRSLAGQHEPEHQHDLERLEALTV